jgi:hypothetical protein
MGNWRARRQQSAQPTFVGDEVAVIGSFARATLGFVREPWGPHSAVRHSHCASTAQATPIATATLMQTPTASAALWPPRICELAALTLPGVCKSAALTLPGVCKSAALGLPGICKFAALALPGVCKPAALALPSVCEPAGLARAAL